MSRQAVCLATLVQAFDPVAVEAFCAEAHGAPLGWYWAGASITDGRFTLTEKEMGPFLRAEKPGGSQRPFVRGPRTQPGLYQESFGGRDYLRKRCTCRATEKRLMADVANMAVTIRGDNTVSLVF